MKKLSQSLEDYLEAIYIISKGSKVVRVKEIAGSLKVKTPSVVDAISKLSKKQLVTHEKYGYLELTRKGIELARNVHKKHEEVAKFFNIILGVSMEISLKDACNIEHYISKETFEKMIKFIEFIESCPVGYPEWLSNFNHFAEYGKRPEGCPKK